MSFFNIIKLFSQAKSDQMANKFVETLATIDPDTMSDAAMLELEEKFDQITKEVAAAQLDFQKELKEAQQAKQLHNDRLKAANIVAEQLKIEPNNEKLNAQLSELVDLLEQSEADVIKEESEANEAEVILNELQTMANEIATQLKTLRKQLTTAKRNLTKAEIDKERAQQREERAKVLAGIKKSSSGFSQALDSINRATEQANTTANASKLRAELLKTDKQDDVVSTVLKGANTNLDVYSRLAKLQQVNK